MAIKERKRPQTEQTKPKKRSRKETSALKYPDDLIPTGCTVLNCALADNPYAGFRKGRIINIIGDSSAGKTILAFTCFAAVASTPDFDEYRLIHDDAEQGQDFDVKKLFGNKLLKRLEAPAVDEDGEGIPSGNVQDFHMHVLDALDEERPFIYVLDSWDSIDSEEDEKKVDEFRKAWKKGNKTAGNYGAAKARQASQILRNIRLKLKKTNSILIIISQTREKLNAGMFESKVTRSGGAALKFYSWHELWLFLSKKIDKEFSKGSSKKKIQLGVNTNAALTKNRQTGKNRKAHFPIFYDLGIDDVQASIEFLLEWDYLKKEKQTLVIPELDFKGTKQKLVEHIENNNLETALQKLVGECWTEIENDAKLERKRRFE